MYKRVQSAVLWIRRLLLIRAVQNLVNRLLVEIRRHGMRGVVLRVPNYVRNYKAFLKPIFALPPAGDATQFDAIRLNQSPIGFVSELEGIQGELDVSVSVVLPTLNAGAEFSWLLRKLNTQQGLRSIEIVVVDSGSSDETLSLAQKAGCKIIEIPSGEFTHSHARNLGASRSTGDYLLFMVQDAYPIGNFWIYAMVRYLIEHLSQSLAAVSCAEYSRSDSDVVYDWMIATHYRFLGCSEADRIGEYKGDDHTLLRSYAQLSDVSCLLAKEVFDKYRYRGDYAEDLDLGIRLVKDGFRVAMLSSIKVIHSHNRSSYYYLKRTFVDTVYLIGMFNDYGCPRVDSISGLMAGIVSTASHLSEWMQAHDNPTLGFPVSVTEWRTAHFKIRLDVRAQLGDEELNGYIDSLGDRYIPAGWQPDRSARNEARAFVDAFLAKLEHFSAYYASIYVTSDPFLRSRMASNVRKIYAATVGGALGYMCMDIDRNDKAGRDVSQVIRNELQVGI